MFALGLFLFGAPLQNLTSFGGFGQFLNEYYYSIIQWFMWVLSVPFGAATFKYYAFRSSGAYVPQALKSYSVYLPAQILSSVGLIVFVKYLHVHPLIGQAGTLVFATVVSYFGHKYITFRAPVDIIEEN